MKPIVLFSFLFFIFFVTGATSATRMNSEWHPVANLKDNHTIEIVEFAIKYIDKALDGANLKLVQVDKGIFQKVGDGVIYRFVFMAFEITTQFYEATILEGRNGDLKVLSYAK
ncbi:unnamed protein product [Linum trigynum]|uniref:Cystatin domain-containing protein n=1 Tax=Linum trigynum TaxID=586398 RepID=A0AAV2D0M1_9ROSI